MTASPIRPSWAEVEPELRTHGEPGEPLTLLLWRLPQPALVVSSAPFGGGLGRREWVLNAQVPHSYARLDPHVHLLELGTTLGLTGQGVGMLTAVDVGTVLSEEDGGARVDASIGVTMPTWAAAPDEPFELGGPSPGTINVVGIVPERLSHAAMVNAVMTVTEAKSQALWEAGIPATGTASDAVCIICPDQGPAQSFGGPRSPWGARLARAVYRAVASGCRRSAPS